MLKVIRSGFPSTLHGFPFLIFQNAPVVMRGMEYLLSTETECPWREAPVKANYHSKLGGTTFDVSSTSFLRLTKEEGPLWRMVEVGKEWQKEKGLRSS